MISHLKIPSFTARVFQRNLGKIGEPLIVVDPTRILGTSPEARNLGLDTGQLLETTDIPEQVERVEFDLETLIREQNNFLNTVQSVTPLVESFAYGEIFAEIDRAEKFDDLTSSLPYEDCLPVSGALTVTGWMARILTMRCEPGEFNVIEEDKYPGALRTVTRDELWGMGSHLADEMKRQAVDNLAEIYRMNRTERRRRFSGKIKPLEEIFQGRDPRPFNPFSRPQSVSQSLRITDDYNRKSVAEKLGRFANKISASLRTTKSLSHELRLAVKPDEGSGEVASHVFSNPTCKTDTLQFATDSLFSKLSIEPPVEIKLEARSLVGNPRTYHEDVEDRYEDLRVL